MVWPMSGEGSGIQCWTAGTFWSAGHIRLGAGASQRRSRSDWSWRLFLMFGGFRVELVAEATNGEEITRLGGLGFDVAAEAHNEVVNGAGVGVFEEVPDILKNGFAGDGFAAIADEVAEKFAFHERQLKDLVAAAELQLLEVHGLIAELKDLGFRGTGLGRHGCGRGGMLLPVFAAEEALHAGEKNRKIEGFRQVVVGAGFESAKDVFGAAASGEHEQRDVILGFAQFAGDGETVFAR